MTAAPKTSLIANEIVVKEKKNRDKKKKKEEKNRVTRLYAPYNKRKSKSKIFVHVNLFMHQDFFKNSLQKRHETAGAREVIERAIFDQTHLLLTLSSYINFRFANFALFLDMYTSCIQKEHGHTIFFFFEKAAIGKGGTEACSKTRVLSSLLRQKSGA